jgi:hypothetical protein
MKLTRAARARAAVAFTPKRFGRAAGCRKGRKKAGSRTIAAGWKQQLFE